MATLKRPARIFSFSDWGKHHPRDPAPGDRLDAQFFELIDAIHSTQQALAELRRDDGRLRSGSVGPTQLEPGLRQELVGDIGKQIEPYAHRMAGVATAALNSERNAASFAEDAERAVIVARQLTSGLDAIRQIAVSKADYVQRAAGAVDVDATDAENWANYAQAQAENAEADKNEALQWAEYLAGPVVDQTAAPAYIAASPFPSGLYYQPVEGGLAGLWSAKWWALYARSLVGTAGFYYLGPSPTPPVPGQQNPATGAMVPNPLPVGSLYFDTTGNQLMVWDGMQWQSSAGLTPAFVGRYVYTATAGQQTFSGVDDEGLIPVVGNSPSDVFINGVRLTPNDYTVDNGATANSLTIAEPLDAGCVVQWDLFVPPGELAPGAVNSFKMKPFAPDGTITDFHLSYIDPGSGDTLDADVGQGAQLLISLDGIIQEPGVDYTAAGATLSMSTAPRADAHFWAVWYQPGAPAS